VLSGGVRGEGDKSSSDTEYRRSWTMKNWEIKWQSMAEGFRGQWSKTLPRIMEIHKLSRGKLRPIDVTVDQPLFFLVNSTRSSLVSLQFLEENYFGMSLRARVRDCFSSITLDVTEVSSHKMLLHHPARDE
jgi:hypothetical protein